MPSSPPPSPDPRRTPTWRLPSRPEDGQERARRLAGATRSETVDRLVDLARRLLGAESAQVSIIADVQTVEAPAPTADEPSVAEQAEQCDTLLCRWRAFVRAHLQRVKGMRKDCGAHMKHGQHAHAMPTPGDDGARVVGTHYHSWRQLFRNVTSYILMPVLVGIVAGVSLSM